MSPCFALQSLVFQINEVFGLFIGYNVEFEIFENNRFEKTKNFKNPKRSFGRTI